MHVTPPSYCAEHRPAAGPTGANMGWVCPKCQTVWGPQVACCLRCDPRVPLAWASASSTTQMDNPYDQPEG